MELITPFQIYIFTRLDVLCRVFGFMIVFGFILSLFSGGLYLAAYDDDEPVKKCAGRICKVCLFMLCFGVLGTVLVPSRKEAAAIWAVPKVVNNQQVQSIGTNTLNLAEMGLEYLQQLLTEKKGNKKNDNN